MRMRIVSNGTPTAWMEGQCTSYAPAGTSLSLTVDTISGSGAFADWNLGLAGVAGPLGPVGPQGPVGDISAPLGGKLTLVSSTQLAFLPFKGDRIKINGTIYQIPTTGVVGLAATGVYINGVAGQNLAASTFYFVYCFNNAGTLTADFSTTGHATSQTLNNVGIEIKNGDNTRSLIGAVFCASDGNFYDTSTYRYVRSWFNRVPLVMSSGSLSSGWGVYFVAFAGDAIHATLSGTTGQSSALQQQFLLYLDGVTANTVSLRNSGISPYFPVSLAFDGQISSDARHTVTATILTSGGSVPSPAPAMILFGQVN
jgi:hypothetical protein